MLKSPHHLFILVVFSFSSLRVFSQSDISSEIEPSNSVRVQTTTPDTATNQPILVLKGSVQLGIGQAQLSDNYPSWHDSFARGNVNLGSAIGVLNWEASKQSHFSETGQTLSLSLTHDLNEDWYGTVGVGRGANASFLPKRRIDVAIYRKWLEDRRLITGLQFTNSKSGDGNYRDQAWQVSSSYYFPIPLVAEIGFKRTVSNPGKISTSRYYGAATYGEDKKYFLSARYDTGYEGYMPQGNFNSAVNFKSTVTSVTWRQWQSPVWGYELQAERYKNPSYKRDSLSTSIFYDY
jgi:YaiO family outer membrane protein